MSHAPNIRLASLVVAATGLLWGRYWVPVRAMEGLGLTGAAGTLAITCAGALVLVPAAIRRRAEILNARAAALASIAIGGAAFALYSIGFVYGRVAIIVLLYFLTPVWSTLIARYVLGWETPRLRLVAIGLGLAGLATMLAAGGTWPVPRGPGEWLALLAGLLWSVGTTGMRLTGALTPAAAAFVFALEAAATSAVLLVFLPAATGAAPLRGPAVASLALVTGALWWAASVAVLVWATVRLDPARVGILLMTEVLVGAISAAIFAGEHLAPAEVAGGALVILAAILEVWPQKRRTKAPAGAD
jgi:drug/metabolite transporter (DMT)-like permease